MRHYILKFVTRPSRAWCGNRCAKLESCLLKVRISLQLFVINVTVLKGRCAKYHHMLLLSNGNINLTQWTNSSSTARKVSTILKRVRHFCSFCASVVMLNFSRKLINSMYPPNESRDLKTASVLTQFDVNENSYVKRFGGSSYVGSRSSVLDCTDVPIWQ